MAKANKQNRLLYAALAVTVVVAVYLNLPQDTPPTVHKSRTFISDSAAVTILPEDETNVHFSKYTGTNHDPFIPVVALDNPSSGGPGSLVEGGKWQLTGINTINGVTSALIENSTGDRSVFLQVGDKWNGLRVGSISDDAINFVNALGQVTQLGFSSPVDPTLAPGAVANSNAPSVNQISPLPPLTPDLSTQPYASFRQNGRQQ